MVPLAQERISVRTLPVLRVGMRPSFELALVLAGTHLSAVAISLYALAHSVAVAVACSVILLNASWVIARHALLWHRGSVVEIELTAEDMCVLRARDGVALAGKVLPSTHVTLWLIVLNVGVAGRYFPHRVVIWRDSLPPQELRRLRVRLRWSWTDTASEHRHAPL